MASKKGEKVRSVKTEDGKEFAALERGRISDEQAFADLMASGGAWMYKFVGGDDAEPPVSVIDGELTIALPSAKEQKAGFYHKDGVRLAAAFPQLYKKVISKGAK